jgi:hypothetical protein
MKTFSVARAFSAGVDLIERKPFTLVWWALAVILLQFAPRYILSAATGANELGAMQEVFDAALGAHDPARLRAAAQHLSQAQGGMRVWGLLWTLWGLFVSAILYNAAYRSVLEPQKSSFGYLRLGAAELWQFLVLVVVTVAMLVYIVACVFAFAMIATMARALGAPAQGWVVGITLAVMIVVTYWLMLRLSLGTVITFARKRFAYFESWSLTKGRVWKLFWTGFLTFGLVIGLYVMLVFTVILSAIPLGSLVHAASGAAAPASAHAGTVAAEFLTWGSLIVGVWLSLISIVTAVVQALTLTPWATAYQAMTADEPAAH